MSSINTSFYCSRFSLSFPNIFIFFSSFLISFLTKNKKINIDNNFFQTNKKGFEQLSILHIESNLQNENYICPYSIQTNPHPLISILTYRPEAWFPVLLTLENIIQKFSQSDSLVVMNFLEPFLKFIFLEPTAPINRIHLRSSLHNLLIKLASKCNETQRNLIFSFLLSILHYFPEESPLFPYSLLLMKDFSECLIQSNFQGFFFF